MAAAVATLSTMSVDTYLRIDDSLQRIVNLETRFTDLEPRLGASYAPHPVDDSLGRPPGAPHPVRANSLP